MLQNIRNNAQGPTTKVIIWLIVISFAAFGIESILVGGGGGGVAEVNDEEISPQELQQAINTQKRRLISMMGDNIDPAMLDDEFLGPQALDALIERKLLMQSAEAMNLTVSKKEIGSLIGSMEQFQIEGEFSPQLYTSVLSSAGYTPSFFKETLRDDLALAQLRSGLVGSEFVTPMELVLNARLDAEQRDLRFLTIPLQAFVDSEAVSEDKIQQYYQAHQEDFRSPETVELDYIELAVDDFHQPVDEQAILEAYQLEIDNNQYQTENRVSHILFETRDGEDEQALQQRIDEAQARLTAGTAFAEVAGEYSDDIGSAASGGDLGFTSGDAFPPEMEEAIASLPLDTVSAPVKTDAGTHLILVTERKEGSVPELEELRPKLEEQLQLTQARVELLRTVEELRDLVFNAEDLSRPAAELELEVKRSDAIARNQADGLFASPVLLGAAFSEEVLEAGHNSEVIELGNDRFVVLRSRKHNLPQVRDLAAVHESIAAILIDETARANVTAEAERIIQALATGTPLEEVTEGTTYAWQVELAADRRNTSVPREVLSRVFEMSAPKSNETQLDYVLSTGGDAHVIALERVSAGQFEALEQPSRMALQSQVSGEYANLLNAEFQRGLREDADISVM